MVLNFNCMLVLLSMCRNIISLIRSNLKVRIPNSMSVYLVKVVCRLVTKYFDLMKCISSKKKHTCQPIYHKQNTLLAIINQSQTGLREALWCETNMKVSCLKNN